jgi:protocatechuate 3,4-dioxygenase beta subunit
MLARTLLARPMLASYVALAVSVGGMMARPTPTAPTSTARLAGVIAGSVRDPEGAPIEGALVELLGTGRSTRSIADGRFLLDSVSAGRGTLRISLQGYLPAQTEIRVADDSATTLEVVLVPDGQPLAPVRVLAKARGRIFGTVVDSIGRPLPGVSVGLVGSRGTTLTDSSGQFQFVDLAPGQYLVEARRVGFELSRYPVRMADNIERIVTMRLRSGPMALTRVELHNTEVAAQDAHARIGMRSMAKSFIMSREDLRESGKTPLDVVLQRSAFRDYMRGRQSDAGALDSMCVLVDGWRALGRGLSPIDQNGGDRTLNATPGPPTAADLSAGTRLNAPPNTGGWLRTFYADEVEMLEVYVANTDYSRTLCARFSYGSGCSCPPYMISPPTVVIWLKK